MAAPASPWPAKAEIHKKRRRRSINIAFSYNLSRCFHVAPQ
jgi:hypothetical protein